MKLIVMGNAGAGKTTLTAELMKSAPVARLSLDALAFGAGAERRPLEASVHDALDFFRRHQSWVVEGCYADIIEPLLGHCETLIFLNPGVTTCIENCRSRPWEPEKFASAAAQQENLENLIRWVSQYETRTDEYGLHRHRALYESFAGSKLEVKRRMSDAAQLLAAAGSAGAGPVMG